MIYYEYTMIAYIYQYTIFQVFSYVNISKLCCKACLYQIKTFNHTINIILHTRDFHNKWYGRQAKSELGKVANQNKVNTIFLTFIEEELCKHKLGNCMVKNNGASNSSGFREPMILTCHCRYKVSNIAKLEKIYRQLC